MESPQRTSCCSGPHRGPHSEISWKSRPAHGLLRLYLILLRMLHVWLGRRSRLSWLPGKEARLSSRSVTRGDGSSFAASIHVKLTAYGIELDQSSRSADRCILNIYLW